jgi:hypothetical protein
LLGPVWGIGRKNMPAGRKRLFLLALAASLDFKGLFENRMFPKQISASHNEEHGLEAMLFGVDRVVGMTCR